MGGYAQELMSPEDIIQVPGSDGFLISNAGDGLLKQVKVDGTVENFGMEAKGSHGIATDGVNVYSCFKRELRSYNIKTKSLEAIYRPSGASFLNDVCIGSDGALYITDFNTKKIYRAEALGEGRYDEPIAWKSLDRIPSALSYDFGEEELIITTWGKDSEFICLDPSTAKVNARIQTGYDNVESIMIHKGAAVISSWGPDAVVSYPDGVRGEGEELEEIEITRPTGLLMTEGGDLMVLSADMNSADDLVKNLDSKDLELGLMDLSVFPNPMSTSSMISFELETSGYVSVQLFDSKGNRISTLFEGSQRAGVQQILCAKEELSSGLYFVLVQSGDKSEAMAVTILD